MTKSYLLLLLLLALVSNVFSQKVWYTLTDKDVKVVNGVITLYNRKYEALNIVIPEVLQSQTIVGIWDGYFKTPTMYSVFANKGITGVKFPTSMKHIGNMAFRNCKITEVYFNEGLEYIGEDAFLGNEIADLILPNSLKKMGDGAFCLNKLTRFNFLPAGIDTIPNECFGSNLFVELIIPKQVKYIGKDAFLGYEKLLKKLTFEEGSSIKYIGESAFESQALEELVLPEGLEHIGQYAFLGNNIRIVNVPRSLKYLGYGCFRSNQITELFIPNTRVKYQNHEGFANNKISKLVFETGIIETGSYLINQISEVILPEGLKIITQEAFSGNPLKNITIPSSVDSIGPTAFAYTLIETIQWPKNIRYIPNNALRRTPIFSFTVPNNVKYIDYGAFSDCRKLESLIFEEGSVCDSIAEEAFQNCISLKQISFPPSLKIIGEEAFKGCTSLTKVHIKDKVKYISKNAFIDSGIEEVIFESNLDSIAYDAFLNCKIKQVTIPESVRYLSGFRNNEIEVVNFKEGVEVLDYAFANNKLKAVNLPHSLKIIDLLAFSENQIEVVDLASVEIIGDLSFKNNKLDTIVLPPSVWYIGSSAFEENPMRGFVLPGDRSERWLTSSGQEYWGGDVVENLKEAYYRPSMTHQVTFTIIDLEGKPFKDGFVENNRFQQKFPINSEGKAVVEVVPGIKSNYSVYANSIEKAIYCNATFTKTDVTYKIVKKRSTLPYYSLKINVSDGIDPIPNANLGISPWWGKNSETGELYRYNIYPTEINLPRVDAPGFISYQIKESDFVREFPMSEVNIVLKKNPNYTYKAEFTTNSFGILEGNTKQFVKTANELSPIKVLPNVGFNFYAWVGANGEIISKHKDYQFQLRDLEQEISVRYSKDKQATGISDERTMKSIDVYPNPAFDFINIKGFENCHVRLISNMGPVLQKHYYTGGTQLTMDIRNYKPGLYIMELTSCEGTIIRKKIIIQ